MMKYFTSATAAIFLIIGSAATTHAAIYRNYNIGTDGDTNYEVGEAAWTGNVFQLQTRAGGTGTLRTIQLTTGTSTGLVIDSSGEVGINIASPTAKLHFGAIGTAADEEFLKAGIDGEFAGSIKFFDDDDEVNQHFKITFSASTEDLRFHSDQTDNILYLDNAGNVGISDGTPTEGKLVVGGTGYFNNTVTVGTPVATGHAATKDYVDSTVATSEFWKLSGSNLYASSTAYNVAVGTSTPYGKLHVFGIGWSDQTSNADTTLIPTTTPAGGFVLDGSYGDGKYRTRLVKIDRGGNLPLYVQQTTGAANSFVNVARFGGHTYSVNEFEVFGDMALSGELGVGTTTPQAALHVINNANQQGLGVQQSGNSANSAASIYGQYYGLSVGTNANSSSYYALNISSGVTTASAGFTGGSSLFYVRADGNVGIASSSPGYGLAVVGTGYFSQPVVVGTPTTGTHATTRSYVDSAITGGSASTTAACTGDATCEMNGADLQGGDITGVDKLSVTTIDPLYEINGVKYATYAASIAGGVKEEYVGNGKLVTYNKGLKTYEYAIDFDELDDGSALWVWRKTVDFSDDNVQVFATPKGVPVPIAYEIDGNKIIFRAGEPVQFSYRLIGNRFDWRNWPTLAEDQTERAGLIIK